MFPTSNKQQGHLEVRMMQSYFLMQHYLVKLKMMEPSQTRPSNKDRLERQLW